MYFKMLVKILTLGAAIKKCSNFHANAYEIVICFCSLHVSDYYLGNARKELVKTTLK